jgi:hemoglobin-like flavoprotein
MTNEVVETFQASLNRCLADPAFMKDFYDRFIASSDEVREKFRNTDFQRQNRALADSLYIMAVAAQAREDSIGWREMSRLAKRHGRTDRDVKPELYDLWLDCLLDAAKAHDPQFSPDVEAAWRSTLAAGIEFMKARY